MRNLPCLAIVLAILALCMVRAPHLRLAARLISNEIDGTPLPVVNAGVATFRDKTISARYGGLVFEVPAFAVIEPASPGRTCGHLCGAGRIEVCGIASETSGSRR